MNMDELLLLENLRLKQMLEIAAIDISKLINCNFGDYLHDLSTRDYYEERSNNARPRLFESDIWNCSSS